MLLYTMMLENDPDKEIFSRLYQLNYAKLGRMAAHLLGPGPQAEDAVHDTFMKLIRHFEQLRGKTEDSLSSWLAVVLKNTALDMLRREKRQISMGDSSWEPSVPADEGGFQALVEVIRQMPQDYRRVLELRFVAEWSLQEIAEEMDLTESAVKTRIFRGRWMLIDQLRKEGYLDGRLCI